MNSIPKQIREAITATGSALLASVAVPQAQIEAAFHAFFNELEGRGTVAITNSSPLDRVLSRKQASEIIGCCTTSITRMVKSGKLRAVYGGVDGKRLTGIAESSVRAFTEGRAE